MDNGSNTNLTEEVLKIKADTDYLYNWSQEVDAKLQIIDHSTATVFDNLPYLFRE